MSAYQTLVNKSGLTFTSKPFITSLLNVVVPLKDSCILVEVLSFRFMLILAVSHRLN